MTDYAKQAASIVKQKAKDFKPKLGIVLGSGLGKLTESLSDTIEIPYEELPGFPTTTIKGHGKSLLLGYLNNLPVACCHGRSHYYEGDKYEFVRTYVRTLKLIGCEYFFATNAAGSLQTVMHPGSLMMITDHINMQPGNPLIGPNDEEFGTRFPPLDNAYDPDLGEQLKAAAKQLNIDLHHGIYLAVMGPSYETPAEIHAFQTLGADAVGMSTIPEVIVARHCGLKCAAISVLTNYGTGMTEVSHDHNDVVALADKAANDLTKLVEAFAGQLSTN